MKLDRGKMVCSRFNRTSASHVHHREWFRAECCAVIHKCVFQTTTNIIVWTRKYEGKLYNLWKKCLYSESIRHIFRQKINLKYGYEILVALYIYRIKHWSPLHWLTMQQSDGSGSSFSTGLHLIELQHRSAFNWITAPECSGSIYRESETQQWFEFQHRSVVDRITAREYSGYNYSTGVQCI